MTDRAAGASAAATSVALDADCFDCAPDYQPLRDAIDADDAQAFDETLRSWPAEDASRALFHLGEHDGPAYRTFCDTNADVLTVKIANAYAETSLAERITTSAPGGIVTQRRHADARRALARAETMLIDVCAADPALAPAWTARMLTARLLGLAASEARRRYDHVVGLGGDFWAQLHYHQYLEPRWFGSVDAARAFVDAEAGRADEGALGALLVALFHLERSGEFDGPAAARAYLRRPAVQAEIASSAARSVGHPSRTELTATTVYAHQVFVTLYWLAGEKEKAARHVAAMNGRTAYENWVTLAPDEPGQAAIWRELTALAGRAA